jgi:hypothetical protein
LVDLQYRERDALTKVGIQQNNEIANKRREIEEADTKSFLESMEWGDDIFNTMFQEPSSGSLPPDTLKFNLLGPPPSNTVRAERKADEIMSKAAHRGLENNWVTWFALRRVIVDQQGLAIRLPSEVIGYCFSHSYEWP